MTTSLLKDNLWKLENNGLGKSFRFWYRGGNFLDEDLKEMELGDEDKKFRYLFISRIFVNVNFSLSKFGNIEFREVLLDNANFSNSKIYRFVFENSCITKLQLRSAECESIEFGQSNLCNCIFFGAKFQTLAFLGFRDDNGGLCYSFCNCLDMKDVEAKKIVSLFCMFDDFRAISMRIGDWESSFSKWVNSNFNGLAISKADISNSEFMNSNFTNSNLSKSQFSNCKFDFVDFSHSNISFSVIGNNAKFSNFNSVVVRSTKFIGSFYYCTFQNADLAFTTFINVYFYKCDFLNANLEGCDFTGACFEEVNFEGANLNAAVFTDAKNISA